MHRVNCSHFAYIIPSNVITVAWTKHTQYPSYIHLNEWKNPNEWDMLSTKKSPKRKYVWIFFSMALEHVSIDGFSVFFFILHNFKISDFIHFLSAKMAVIQVRLIFTIFFQLKICVWFKSGELYKLHIFEEGFISLKIKCIL